MKTKYVFLFIGCEYPDDLAQCYIFSNIADASSFFKSKGYYLNIYSGNTSFYITGSTNNRWHGDILEGKYF